MTHTNKMAVPRRQRERKKAGQAARQVKATARPRADLAALHPEQRAGGLPGASHG